jgi:hypothetical protein
VALLIKRTDFGYEATVTPPHAVAAWETNGPITARDLLAALLQRGCHQTDVGDAFYAADPRWLDGLE